MAEQKNKRNPEKRGHMWAKEVAKWGNWMRLKHQEPGSCRAAAQRRRSVLSITALWDFLKARKGKAMAPHSSTLAWKIPWMEEPGRLQSMGSLRVRHDWATFLLLFTFMHWRRKWQPTPVFLPGESQGQGSLVGCRLWGRTESDTTEAI